MTGKKSEEMIVAPAPDTSIEALITRAIDKGVPVETMERLLAMRKELKQERAKEEYDRAMAAFQSEAPIIKKTKIVRTSEGEIAYRFAPIESAYAQVKDLILKHGFSYSTSIEMKEKSVKAVVKVNHEGGHSEESPMEVALGNKTKVMSDSQVIAAASTFAKRYAFLNAFGLLTGGEDNDALTPRAPRGITIETPDTGRRAKVAASDNHENPEEMSLAQQRKRIAEILQARGIDFKDKKWAAQHVADETEMILKEENYAAIINALEKR